MLTVQNQLQRLFVQRPPCQNTNFLQHLPHHHFYKAYNKNHFETLNTHYPSDQFVLGARGETNTLQTKYQILVVMSRDSKLMHSSKSEIIMCGTPLFTHTNTLIPT